METLRSDTIHTSDSIRSLSCINTHHIDEISKEKEDELLYGTGDDGDEEDALSDDSMRLRLSDDDEAESEDVLTSVLDDQQNNSKHKDSEVTSGESKGAQASTVPEKNVMENDTTAREINEEEQCSGNVSMDDTIITDREKDTKRNENGLMRPQPAGMPRYPRFPSSLRYQSFHSSNHHFYTRQPYLIPRGHYRTRLYDYNHRSYNAFLPFNRGRGGGKFNSYNKSVYGHRQQNKPFKPATMKKQNTTNESHQNLVSSSNTNISSRTEFDDSIKDISVNVNKIIEKNDALDSDYLINNEKNNGNANELSNTNMEDSQIEDFEKGNLTNAISVDSSLESQHKLKSIEENSEISLSNDIECKNIIESKDTIENNVFNKSSSETITNSIMNSNDNSEDTNENKTSTNNVDSDNSDFHSSNNFKILEKLLTEGTKCKSDSDEVADCIGKDNVSDEKQNETITIDLDMNVSEKVKQIYKSEEHEPNMGQQSTEVNHRIELTQNNCKIVSHNIMEEELADNDLTINGKLMSHKVDENFKSKEESLTVQNTKLNEGHEDNVLEQNSVILNNLINKENDEEIEVIQNNTLLKPIDNIEQCDKDQLNDSDNSTNSIKSVKLITSEDESVKSKIDLYEQNKDTIDENVQLTKNESLVMNSENKTSESSESIEIKVLDKNNLSHVKLQNDSVGSVTGIKDSNGDSDKKTIEVPIVPQRRRRRTKKMIAAAHEAASEEDKQVKESGRQKRRTAKNAEEIIRKKFLNHDSDLESSDGSEKFVIVNHKMNQDARPLSPPSLKRNCSDTDNVIMNGSIKKIRINSDALSDELATKENNSQNIKKLDYVRKFFQRDLKEKLPKLRQEELEELLIQKIVETITMRGEIGRLREQARISERNQEVTRAKCQQLTKQIKDFEMVLIRNASDRRANNDKPTPPIKINRSVGLQVNFITDHGMQNLRQLQQSSNMKSLQTSNGNNNSSPNASNNDKNNVPSPRRGIKVRSPRRIEPAPGQPTIVSQNHTQSPNIIPTITPAALVVAKPVDTPHTLTLSSQPSIQQIISNQQTQSQQPQQTIVLNGKFPNQINRQSTTVNVAKSRTNDLIDLTDEEEKSKAAATVPVVTTTVTDQQINLAQKTTQPCFQRVIQTIPGGNVAITSQPPSIRVVQPASQPTPTALVNNMNARLAYVMQSGVGPTRQLLIAPNSNPMRPVTSCTRASFSTLTYKTGISTVANGTVRVLTTSATSNVQFNKHPAPLPDARNYVVNPLWKLPPPAPSLKISKVANGIVLSWNMNLSDKYADIASYQLYAYQEVVGIAPNPSLWKKVGDVRALPLPMACTLTQFSEGNNYYFAVRAVDTHSRKGQYSIPGNISL